MGELVHTGTVLRDDAPFYTEEELDALYERDPVTALRLSRRQHALAREIESARGVDPHLPKPTVEAISALLEKARAILRRDGGDLELVELENDIATIRMTGSCSACPRSALDVKHVVERIVRERFPQVRVVRRLISP